MSPLRLILMRHAEAEPASGAGDHARSLSRRGAVEAAEAGRRLAALLRPDLVLASDSARTRGTVERLAPAFAGTLPRRYTRALYATAAEAILAEVRGTPSDMHSLLVVGHNPGIADLARRLAAGGDPATLADLGHRFPTSCFAVIALDGAAWAEAGDAGRLDGLFHAGATSGP